MAWGENAWATEVEEEELNKETVETTPEEPEQKTKAYVPPSRLGGGPLRPGATPDTQDEGMFPSLGDAANVTITKKEKKKKQVLSLGEFQSAPAGGSGGYSSGGGRYGGGGGRYGGGG